MEIWSHPTGKIPERVGLIALGPSKSEYISAMLSTGWQSDFDEVWTVNHGMRIIKHDLAFDMHEYRYLQGEFQDDNEGQDAYHKSMVLKNKEPVIMLDPYPDIPHCFKYPLAWVLRKVGPDNIYFNNTIAYMLAYSIALKVKEVGIFGADFHYGDIQHKESGRGCTEFWIGYGRAKGIQMRVCAGSTLTDANTGRPLYGYKFSPPLTRKPAKGAKNVKLK